MKTYGMPTAAIKEKILILQNEREFSLAKKKFGDSLSDLSIVAWSPSAVDILMREKFSFSLSSDHQHVEWDGERAVAQYKAFEHWCDLIDRHVCERVSEAASLKIRPFHNSMVTLRMFFSVLFNEIDKLHGLCKDGKSSEVYFFYYPEPQPSLLSRLFDLGLSFEKRSVKFNQLDNAGLEMKACYSLNNIVPNWQEAYFSLSRMKKKANRFLRYGNISSLLQHCNWGAKRKTFNLLVLSSPWEDLESTLRVLKKDASYNLIIWDPFVEKPQLRLDDCVDDIMADVENDRRLQSWTIRNGVSIFNLCKPMIRQVIQEGLPQQVAKVNKFVDLHRKIGIDFVVSSYWDPCWEAIYDQCVYERIPAAFSLHGGTVGHFEKFPPLPIYFRGLHEHNPIFFSFVYSPAIAEYLDNMKDVLPNFTVQNIAAGSPYFEKHIRDYYQCSVRQKANQRLSILYVCGPPGGVLGQRGAYEDPALYMMRHDIVRTFANDKDISVHFKYGFNINMLAGEVDRKIKSHFWRNIKFLGAEKKLVDFLREPDLFVIECPSTVLCEVLTTAKPVIALFDDRCWKLTPLAHKLLERRVTIVKSREEMVGVLDDVHKRRFQSSAFTVPDHRDSSFVKTFTTCGDSNGGFRTASFIKNIVERRDFNPRHFVPYLDACNAG